MGLDMYLEAEKYIGVYKKIREPFLNVSKKAYCEPEKAYDDFSDVEKVPTKGIKYIEYEIGYWRKVNWIHKWFVDNVQGGQDDCQNHYVLEKNLKDLKALCEELLKSKDEKEALEKLPPCGEFFFGCSEPQKLNEKDKQCFWEEYWSSLQETVQILEKAINLQMQGMEIFYYSSW